MDSFFNALGFYRKEHLRKPYKLAVGDIIYMVLFGKCSEGNSYYSGKFEVDIVGNHYLLKHLKSDVRFALKADGELFTDNEFLKEYTLHNIWKESK